MRRVGVLALALGLLAGCGDEAGGEGGAGGDDPAPTSSGTPSPTEVPSLDAGFDADVTLDGNLVRIRWTLTNDGDEPLPVVDAVGVDASSLDRTEVYTVGTGDGTTLELSQRVFARPADDDNDYAAPFYAGVTEVAPGERLQRRLAVGLPSREDKPFPGYYADGETPAPSVPAAVVFCLGALAPGTEVLDGRVTHGSDVEQQVFCSDEVQLG